MPKKLRAARPQAARVRLAGEGQSATLVARADPPQPDGPGADHLVASGLQLHQAGRLAEAEAHYRQATERAPLQADAFHLLGVVSLQTGRVAEADAAIRQAVRLAPGQAVFWNSLGAVARMAGRLAAASEHCQHAAALAPDYVDAWDNLAVIHQELGDTAGEMAALEQLTALRPGQAQGWARRGVLAIRTGHLPDAEEMLTRAVTLAPGDVEAWSNLGAAQLMRGSLVTAEESQRCALTIQADFPMALNNLGNVLNAQSRWAEAAEVLVRAVALAPADANGWLNLGHAQKGLEQYADAVAAYERVLALKPEAVEALGGLADALQGLGELERAVALYERALPLSTDRTETGAIYEHLQIALRRLGRLVEAEVAICRRAVVLEPAIPAHLSRLIVVLDLHEGAEAEAQHARRCWNDRFGRPARQAAPPRAIGLDPARRLRVGYVSANFCLHSASNVILPVLRAHDRQQVEVICYSGVLVPDQTIETCRALADVWHDTAQLSDGDLEALIRADQIDILVDLSGHTDGNRLLVFARKPAPIRITAWGYAAGTGLTAMDYFLADPIVVPADARASYVEEVVDLPNVVCYDPPSYAPPVAPVPAVERGYVTFGAFNRLSKISTHSRDAWGRVLAANPTSRLLVKSGGLADTPARAWLLEGLAAQGVAPERVTIMGITPHAEHLATHAEIDVMLDTFPHGGGVTTLDAFLMGVPVVTLLGERVPGRLSASLLAALDLHDLVASTPDEYVTIATSLAGDLERLAQLRATFRERLQVSPVGNRDRYTRAVETVYRGLWRRWCEQRPTDI